MNFRINGGFLPQCALYLKNDCLSQQFCLFFQGTYLDTILPREDLPENSEVLPEIGQRARLSKGDILQTMALYGCPGKKDKNKPCQNNHFLKRDIMFYCKEKKRERKDLGTHTGAKILNLSKKSHFENLLFTKFTFSKSLFTKFTF